MPPRIEFNYFWYEPSNGWRIRIPKSVSVTNSHDRHEFYSEDDAKNAQKIYLRLIGDHGKTLKIPKQTQLYGEGRIKKRITYKQLVDKAKAFEKSDGVDIDSKDFKDAVQLLKARERSKKLSDLKGVIPNIRKPKKGGHYSPEHLRELNRQANKLIEILGDRHLSDFLSLNLIDEFLDHKKNNYSDGAKKKYKGALSSLFKVAVNLKWMDKNPAHSAQERWSDDLKVEVYSVGDSARILNGAKPEMLVTYILGLYAGLRPSECRRVNFEDIRINPESAIVTLNSHQAHKTRNARTIVLTGAAIRLLEPYQGMKGPVSPLPQTKFPPLSDKSDYGKWLRNHYHADLYNKERRGGAFSKDEIIQDGFRHTYATYMYHKMIFEGSTPEEAESFVISQLGHLDKSSIGHYIDKKPPVEDVMAFWSLNPPSHQSTELEQSDYYRNRLAS